MASPNIMAGPAAGGCAGADFGAIKERNRFGITEKERRAQRRQEPKNNSENRPQLDRCAFMGLRVTRPSFHAVSSPRKRATKR